MPENQRIDLSQVNPKFYQRLRDWVNNEGDAESHDYPPDHQRIPIYNTEIPDALLDYAECIITIDDVAQIKLIPEYRVFMIGQKSTETTEDVWFGIDTEDPEFEEIYFIQTIRFINDDDILEGFARIEFDRISHDILLAYNEIINHAVTHNILTGLDTDG
jgi:hypothetical protein